MSREIHAGLAAYLASRQITDLAPGREGDIVLDVDGSLRIHCRPLAQGGLLLDAHLLRLPAGVRERSEFVLKAMHFSAARVRDNPDALVMTENGRGLRLQRRVDAAASRLALETELEDFSHALEVWSAYLGG